MVTYAQPKLSANLALKGAFAEPYKAAWEEWAAISFKGPQYDAMRSEINAIAQPLTADIADPEKLKQNFLLLEQQMKQPVGDTKEEKEAYVQKRIYAELLLIRTNAIATQQAEGKSVVPGYANAQERDYYGSFKMMELKKATAGMTVTAPVVAAPTETAAPVADTAAPAADTAPAPAAAPHAKVFGKYNWIEPEAQVALQKLGYSTGARNQIKFDGGDTALDGAKGPATDAAIIAFKKDYGKEYGVAETDTDASVTPELVQAIIAQGVKGPKTAVAVPAADAAAIPDDLQTALAAVKTPLGEVDKSGILQADGITVDEQKQLLDPLKTLDAQIKLLPADGKQTASLDAVNGLVKTLVDNGVKETDTNAPLNQIIADLRKDVLDKGKPAASK